MTSNAFDASTTRTPIRWGVLGAANIARRRVIPALQASEHSRVVAIASRRAESARQIASELHIPRAYESYEALLADPDIDAVYIPLPNHLHVEWTTKAAYAGKHVLCEKPIALNADEARTLLAVRDATGVQIGEAFMVRSHPRWDAVRKILESGRIGELRVVSAHFSYFKKDESNIRSRADWGGGALLDIGCYPILLSRVLFQTEPISVMATIDRNPITHVDAVVSAMLRFPDGTANFTCAGELVLHQRMELLGTAGRIDVPVPFNPPEELPTAIVIDDGRDLVGSGAATTMIDVANQFVLQGDAFVRAIRGEAPFPMSLEDSVANMSVIDALFRSAASGTWETPRS